MLIERNPDYVCRLMTFIQEGQSAALFKSTAFDSGLSVHARVIVKFYTRPEQKDTQSGILYGCVHMVIRVISVLIISLEMDFQLTRTEKYK